MNKKEYESIRITRDDLINWIDRPPSNDDIDLCDYLVNALDNQFKYKEKLDKINNEIERFKEIIIEQPSEDDTYLLEKLNSFQYIINN